MLHGGSWETEPACFSRDNFPSMQKLRGLLGAAPAAHWAGFQLYYPMSEDDVRASTGLDLVESMLAVFREVTPVMNLCMRIQLTEREAVSKMLHATYRRVSDVFRYLLPAFSSGKEKKSPRSGHRVGGGVPGGRGRGRGSSGSRDLGRWSLGGWSFGRRSLGRRSLGRRSLGSTGSIPAFHRSDTQCLWSIRCYAPSH